MKTTILLLPRTAIFLLTILVISCKPAEEKKVFAYFDFLEYQGYDPIYELVEAADNEYLNPILSGFYPDPSIEKVGDDFYLINSSFAFFPGIPVFHSRDLVNWTQLGHVIDRPEQAPFDSLRISRGIFAPAISWNEGTFYVVCTLVDCGGNFVVTASEPAGPWSNPVFLPFEGIDPSLFFDDDGKAYIVNNGAPEGKPLYQGHRAIWIQEFDKEKLEMTGPRKVLVNGGIDISQEPVWIEGPHIYKANGYYYLCAAEGGTSINHSQVILRSSSIWGPFIPWEKNPVITQRHLPPDRPNPVTCTGHMDLVEISEGDWWSVFLGCTPYEGGFYNTGRQTFMLPVQWEDNWPVVLKGDDAVPFVHSRPDLPAQDPAPVPLNGNFTLRDEFEDGPLPMYYNFIRTPRETWYAFEKGRLKIEARNAAIDHLGQPSFIGRRQQHHYGSAITSVEFDPANQGDKAGLIVFQNREHYYFIGITLDKDGKKLIVEKGSPKGPVRLASYLLKISGDKPVLLKISARGKYYDFAWTTEGDPWNATLEDVDASYLSTDVAGGFVGAYFGMYAFSAKP